MENKSVHLVSQPSHHLNHISRWTISIFILAGLVCSIIAYLHFEQLQTLNLMTQSLDNYRQARLDLAEGFIEVSLSDDENAPFNRSRGLVLLDQALNSYETNILNLKQNEAEVQAFTDHLNTFRNEIDQFPDGEIDAQTRASLWSSYDHLQNHAEKIDHAALASLEMQKKQLTKVFRWTLFASLILFCGIGLGVYRAEDNRYHAELSRKEQEAQYRSVVEDQTDLICRYDNHFKLTFANENYAHAYGVSVAELLGQNIFDRLPHSERETTLAHVESLTACNPVVITQNYAIMPDQSIRWYQWTDRAILDDMGHIAEYQRVGRDITELIQIQHELKTLYEATSALFAADDLQSLGQQAVDTVVKIFDQADCGLLLLDNSSLEISCVARTGTYNLKPQQQLNLNGKGLVSRALHSGELVYAPDTSLEPHDVANEAHTQSELVIPLKTPKGVIGALHLQHSETNAFAESDQRILTAFAERAALVIKTMQLNEALGSYTAELETWVWERTAELEQGKIRVEFILNNSPDAILLLDNDLTIQQTNSKFHALFGCPQGACTGKSLLMIIHPDNINAVNAFIHNDTGELPSSNYFEVQAMRQDGTFFDAELSLKKVPSEGVVCVLRDITERKAQERQLLFHASVQANMSEAVITADPAFYIQSWNKAAEIMYGWTAEEVIGKPARNILQTQYESEEVRQQYLDTLFKRGWMREGVIHQHRTKGAIHVSSSVSVLRDDKGQVIGVVGVNHDISERKAQERQLLFDASVQANMSDAVIVLDMAFNIQSWNKAAEAIYGWSEEEVRGKPGTIILQNPSESHTEREQVRQTLREQGWWKGEVTHQHKDGSLIPVFVSTTILKDKQGVPFGIVAVNHDITEQKAQERQLLFHASVQANMSDAVITVDRAFHIQSWNKAAEIMYGWTAEEVIGKHARSILQTQHESEEVRQQYVDTLFKQGWLQEEVIQQHRTKGAIHVLSSVTLLRDNKGQMIGIVAVNHNFTERKLAEKALRESEERFRRAIIDAPFPIIIHAEDGEVLHLSNVWTKITGYTHAEIATIEAWTEKAYGEQNHHMKGVIDAVYSRMEPYKVGERHVRTKSGDIRIWDFIAAPLGSLPDGRRLVSGMAMDVTERKQAENALRQSETRYRALFEQSADGVFILDLAGNHLQISLSAAEMFGYSLEEMKGLSFRDLVISEEHSQSEHILERLMNGERISIYERRVRRKDGTVFPVEVNVELVRDTDGSPLHIQSMMRDITERKQIEIALQQAFAKEKELGELKTRFISMASHEFRTPLATILATVDTLSAYRDKMSEEKIDQRLDKIKGQVAHLKAIMDEVLMLAGMQAQKVPFNPTKLNLDTLCRSILEEFQTRTDITHQIQYQVLGELPELMLDPKLVRHVISNLVSNAIKYSPEADAIFINLDYRDSKVVMTVRDKGVGIPEADLPHLFEPFYRATNVEAISGTGLGLAIVNEAVELHGGTIQVASQVGVGTTITIEIPSTPNPVEKVEIR